MCLILLAFFRNRDSFANLPPAVSYLKSVTFTTHSPIVHSFKQYLIAVATKQMKTPLIFARKSGSRLPFLFGPWKYFWYIMATISFAQNRPWLS